MCRTSQIVLAIQRRNTVTKSKIASGIMLWQPTVEAIGLVVDLQN